MCVKKTPSLDIVWKHNLLITCYSLVAGLSWKKLRASISEFILHLFPLFSYKSIFSPDFNKAKGKNGSRHPSFPAPAPVQVTHTVSISHQKGMTSNKWDSNNTFCNTVNCLCLLSLSFSFFLPLSFSFGYLVCFSTHNNLGWVTTQAKQICFVKIKVNSTW